MEYEVVIGLEVHAQLLTKTKLFCGCSTQFGAEPNTHGCPVCLGMPGVLPVTNKEAVELALRMALATRCQINESCRFARKNYFYPDLPKGYQISQYEAPLAENGGINMSAGKWVRIKRIHLEEDAGKLIHGEGMSLFDVNRCGVPLIEIVSEPDITSPEEASTYMKKLRQILVYLGICDGNMQEGSLRCDANISVRPKGSEKMGVKTEVKNMNSFRNVQRALALEQERQIRLIEDNQKISQQTLLFDEQEDKVVPMRSKEYAHDYRYFPEPDLVRLQIDQSWLEQIRETLPELPEQRLERFIREYKLPEYDAEVLTSNRELGDYFEECASHTDPKTASNWIMGEVLRKLKEKRVDISKLNLPAKSLAELINLVLDGTLSGNIAKKVFEDMLKTGKSAGEVVKEKGLVQISDVSSIEKMADEVLSNHPDEVKKYKEGKKKVIGFFVGQIMKRTRGKANPKLANQILKKQLEEVK